MQCLENVQNIFFVFVFDVNFTNKHSKQKNSIFINFPDA